MKHSDSNAINLKFSNFESVNDELFNFENVDSFNFIETETSKY